MQTAAHDIHYRTPDAWKIRWCGSCKRYEFDRGVPLGWVTLRGEPPKRDPRLCAMLDRGIDAAVAAKAKRRRLVS